MHWRTLLIFSLVAIIYRRIAHYELRTFIMTYKLSLRATTTEDMFQIDYKIPPSSMSYSDEDNPLTYCQGNSSNPKCGSQAVTNFTDLYSVTQPVTDCTSVSARSTNTRRRRRQASDIDDRGSEIYYKYNQQHGYVTEPGTSFQSLAWLCAASCGLACVVCVRAIVTSCLLGYIENAILNHVNKAFCFTVDLISWSVLRLSTMSTGKIWKRIQTGMIISSILVDSLRWQI